MDSSGEEAALSGKRLMLVLQDLFFDKVLLHLLDGLFTLFDFVGQLWQVRAIMLLALLFKLKWIEATSLLLGD